MKQLPVKFTKYGEQFEQLCRTANTAVYLRHINGRQKTYEVIVIRVADRHPKKTDGKLLWEACEPYETYPSSEKWGQCGWTYTTREDALAKYDLINDPSFKLPAPPIYPIRAHAADGIPLESVLRSRRVNIPEETTSCVL